MSVSTNDLREVRKLLDDITSDDRPAYQNLGLVLALEGVLSRAAAMPGPCDECAHWDAESSFVAGWGYCTSQVSPHNGRRMRHAEGCTKFEAED